MPKQKSPKNYEEPEDREYSSNRSYWIARDYTGGLVGIYREKPTEVVNTDAATGTRRWFRAKPTDRIEDHGLLHVLPLEVYEKVFGLEIHAGECFEVWLDVSVISDS